MLDHLSEGRFEFGTGRGAGSREVTGFDIPNTDATKAVFAEVIGEYKKMWRDEEYSYDGTSFRVPHPDSQWPTRNVLPKPWKKPHPPMWRAAGNPPTYAEAARQGLGVLGFNVASINDMEAPGAGLQGQHRQRGAGGRVHQRQRDDHERRGVPRRRQARPRGRDHDGHQLPAVARLLLPRHVPQAGRLPGVARARAGAHARRDRVAHQRGLPPLRRSRRGDRAGAPVRERRRRPDLLRHAARTCRGPTPRRPSASSAIT